MVEGHWIRGYARRRARGRLPFSVQTISDVRSAGAGWHDETYLEVVVLVPMGANAAAVMEDIVRKRWAAGGTACAYMAGHPRGMWLTRSINPPWIK